MVFEMLKEGTPSRITESFFTFERGQTIQIASAIAELQCGRMSGPSIRETTFSQI
jgi:hypothetical protein